MTTLLIVVISTVVTYEFTLPAGNRNAGKKTGDRAGIASTSDRGNG